MIAFVKGSLFKKTPAHLIVDVQGVGYELHISLNTYEAIQGKEEGLLYTYLQIKEDAHVLFGFSEPAEKELFIHLISVSGVGAATARMMLSSVKPDELIKIIVHGNTAQLEKIKGIGKKTAERIVLELKDKLAKMGPTTNISPLINNTLDQDALNALVALGIGRSAAEQAVKRVLTAEPGNSQVEDIIKKAFKTNLSLSERIST